MVYISSDTNVWIDFVTIEKLELPFLLPYTYIMNHDAIDDELLKYINECARRNSYDTCYRWDTPPRPIEERIQHSQWAVKSSRKDLEKCVARIESEGLSHLTYKLARAALIKAIGDKGAAEYNRREYEKLGEEGRWRQAEEYSLWEAGFDLEEMEDESLLESDAYYREPVSVHEKVIRIRKGLKGSNGNLSPSFKEQDNSSFCFKACSIVPAGLFE